MSKSFQHIDAMAQPDRTSCWSTSLAWWTKTIVKVKDFTEVEIMGKYNHLTGADGGLIFPTSYVSMLKDSLWGLNVIENFERPMGDASVDKLFKKAPVMCGYWDVVVGGYHSVVLYSFTQFDGVWAMDPNGGNHIHRPFGYYCKLNKRTILGYLD